MKSLGLEYIAAALVGPVNDFISQGNLTHLFKTKQEGEAYAYVVQFLTDHGSFPASETVNTHTGVSVPKVIEPAGYYLQHMQRRHIEKSLRGAVEEAGQFMGADTNKDPEKAFEIISEMVYRLSLTEKGAKILDFRDAKSVVISTLAQQISMGGMLGIELGWPSLDQQTGGIQSGDLFSVVARPGMGKTWLLVYMALHAWLQGYVPLLVTLEMPAIQIFQRLAALLAHIPSMALKTGHLTSTQELKLKEDLGSLQESEQPFWIIDGQMSAGIDDAIMITSRLKPDLVLVDGAYMLKHPDKRLGRTERIGEICESLKKDLAIAMNLPVVASWQLNREATKIKKGESVGGEHIADSDTITRTSSVVLGLFEDKTPESIKTREVEYLKGRGGETGRFKLNWDFYGMDFSQVSDEENTSDLEHV